LEKFSRRAAIGVLVLSLVAVWLAIHWPQGSLWYDEGLTAWIAQGGLPRIWTWCTQVDIQVPLHYVALKVWMLLAGESEFALHVFSVFCGLISVASVMAIVRRGRTTAMVAAGLLTGLAAGFVWVAFEVRAYAFALALYSVATVIFLRLVMQRSRPYPLTVAVYCLLMIALLYTHYTGIGGLAAHVLIAGLTLLDRPSWARVRRYFVWFGAIAIGFAPWLPILLARGTTDHSYYPGSIPPLRTLQTLLSFQWLARDDIPLPAVSVIAGLLIVLAAAIALRRYGRQIIIAAVLILVPLVFTAIVVYLKPKLAGRYLWPTWIGIDVILALGISHLSRNAIFSGCIAMVIMGAPYLTGEIGHPPDSDYRAAFAYIHDHKQLGDLLILRDGTLFPVASYYGFPGCETGQGCIGLPASQITDVTHILHVNEAAPILAAQPDSIHGAWVVTWQGDVMEPENLIAGLLETVGTEQPIAAQFGDVRLQYFTLDRPLALIHAPQPSTQPALPLPGGLAIQSSDLIAAPVLHPGDPIVAHVWWSRSGDLPPHLNDLRVSIRLVDSDGKTIGQVDEPPSGFFYYPDHWPPDTLILGRYKMLVPQNKGSGKIDFRLKIYGTIDGSQHDYDIGEVQIAP
jgi:hypothetical protein